MTLTCDPFQRYAFTPSLFSLSSSAALNHHYFPEKHQCFVMVLFSTLLTYAFLPLVIARRGGDDRGGDGDDDDGDDIPTATSTAAGSTTSGNVTSTGFTGNLTGLTGDTQCTSVCSLPKVYKKYEMELIADASHIVDVRSGCCKWVDGGMYVIRARMFFICSSN